MALNAARNVPGMWKYGQMTLKIGTFSGAVSALIPLKKQQVKWHAHYSCSKKL